jgi:hypothetical protein
MINIKFEFILKLVIRGLTLSSQTYMKTTCCRGIETSKKSPCIRIKNATYIIITS